jgi:predicted GNAT family N-acyltransferase
VARHFRTTLAEWKRHREALLSVRYQVFGEEQKVPVEIEVDEHDGDARHAIALDERDRPIGTARVLFSRDSGGEIVARIGRVAVLPDWRREGVGTALMDRLVPEAIDHGAGRIVLHAQVSSIPFYTHLGYEIVGPEFEEAGIPHREMQLPL